MPRKTTKLNIKTDKEKEDRKTIRKLRNPKLKGLLKPISRFV